MDYIAFMHNNGDTPTAPGEWDECIALVSERGVFRGGKASKKDRKRSL